MRILSIITAILVSVFLYFLVIDRDTLMSFAGKDPDTPTQSTDDAQDDTENNVVGVVAIHSTARMIDSAVVLRGQTEATRQVDIRAETSGLVMAEPLRKGAFVEAGQRLCHLDLGTRDAVLAEAEARLAEARARIPATKAQVEEALARLEEANINDNAATKLSEGGYASETRVASAQAAVRGAEANVASARSNLQSTQAGIQSAEAAVAAVHKDIARLEIKAPFNGLLESDTAELGSLVQPGGLCATIIQLDPIRLVAFVPETEIENVTVGALAGARLTTGRELRGRVSFLSRSADPLTRTFRVEIQLPNTDFEIRDGQTVEILIASDGKDAHLVPQSSLTLNDVGDLGVRIVDADSNVKFNPVTFLRDTVDGVWLTGLPPKADVIIIGQEYVIDGVPVRVTFQEPAQ